MAEFAVNLLIDNLVPLLKEEVNLLRGVGGEFESIKRELEVMKPYLQNADERAERGEPDGGVKALVKQLRIVCFRTEDVIDEYILHLLTQRSDQRSGFIGDGCFCKVARSIIKSKPRRKIASEIKAIKKDISVINNLRTRYSLQVTEEGSSSNRNNNVKDDWRDPRVASLFLEEAEVVGIETSRAQLNSWMAEEASSKRTVVTVVGEGGVGKTTLVKKVFDDQIASRKFVCHAWITVSQSPPNDKELLRTLMKKLCETASNAIEIMESLIGKIRDYLHQKRYVVVFDDVWDVRFWEFIKLALPDDNIGSRVIITTRIRGVAPTSCSFDHIYTLEGLPDKKARELFCKKAFAESDYGGICPPELKEVSDEIVRKCNGVPLAIVTIAGLLSTKEKVALKWQKFLDSLGYEMKSNPQLKDAEKIILFSYLDLPSHLKPCFLYFGIFPEDYSIGHGRLVRLWIAEGFIKEVRGKTLEEIAEEYLKELIHRSLVQVGSLSSRGKVFECRVHDIMHVIILSKYEELSFCQVLTAKEDDSILVDGQFRRLSIHDNIIDKVMNSISITTTGGRIRSVFSFGKDKLPESFVNTLVANFKLLKVLDFQDNSALNCLPEAVGDLLHLRYLSLRKTKVKVLPKSIGRLRYLLTLDLKYSHVEVLPIEIKKLRKLRHLIATTDEFRSYGVKIPGGIDGLEELQRLTLVEAYDDGGNLVKKLSKLRQLRKLGIRNLKKEDGKNLCIAIENMSHLQSLKVSGGLFNRFPILELQDILSPPASLQRLFLYGRLEKFPVWICSLKNVVKITFWHSSLREDPLKSLQILPNLVELALRHAYDGKILYFGEGGFPKLQYLILYDLPNLISVKVEEGALPLLQNVNILDCPRLNYDQIGGPLRTIRNAKFHDSM